jgi:hypothetical protein
MLSESDLVELGTKGIRFCAVLESCGNCDLRPSDVLKFISDPEKFDANRCGVSLEEYRAWLRAKSDMQCTGITKSGRRCCNLIIPSGDGQWHPKNFRRGIDDRCHLHQLNRE